MFIVKNKANSVLLVLIHETMINKYNIETAYSFLHQKMRVYVHSSIDWQRDDIEIAISSYIDEMNPELYELISCNHYDYLRCHEQFEREICDAVAKLEKLLLESQ